MKQKLLIPSRIVPSVSPLAGSSGSVAREFKQLVLDGAQFDIAGKAKKNPEQLFERGLKPKHKIELFDTVYYLSNVFQIPELRFYVAYVKQFVSGQPKLYPRIIYKDLSLAWRSASHFSVVEGHIWVGKGDVRIDDEDGFETLESIESTTDLPLEIQSATESLLGMTRRAGNGQGILELVLRKSPANRVEPYIDFNGPRRQAQGNSANLINGGRSVATFKRPGEPRSLQFAKGFEPDLKKGIIERTQTASKLYGGKLRRFRILSRNRTIQYYFLAGKQHVWMYPPQALTTELSSYGVRTIDVIADDDLSIPGFEYHHLEQTANGEELYSQIPEGYAGDPCPADDAKADASPWLNQIPIIKKFRKSVLHSA